MVSIAAGSGAGPGGSGAGPGGSGAGPGGSGAGPGMCFVSLHSTLRPFAIILIGHRILR